MNVTIRAATTADVPAMQRIRHAVKENRLSDPRRITDESYFAFIEDGSICVAQGETAIVGFAAVDLSSKSVWALFVDPNAEGVGIGRLLHAHMLGYARDRGLSLLGLTTAKNTRAARFYVRAGWVATGTTPEGEARFQLSLTS